MRISSIDAAILRDPPTGEETVLTSVSTDDGRIGYGESTACPTAVKAVIEAEGEPDGDWDLGVRRLLIGEDPTDPARLWSKLRSNTFWSCRTGVGHVALAAVDMALWDLAGKIAGKPSWQLMGERRNGQLLAYATMYHGPAPFQRSLALTMEGIELALDAGFRAIKVESMPGNAPEPAQTLALVAAARERLGSEFPLLLDVGYRWDNFQEAECVVRELDQFGLFALEAPFHPGRLSDYALLAEAIQTPLATGDQLTSAADYDALLGSGTLSFVQAGSARTGLSDMGALAEAAACRNLGFIPWGWVPSGLATAANIHRAVVHPNIPMIEYRAPQVYRDSLLRTELAAPEPRVIDGAFALPEAPGLGIQVQLDAVNRFRVG